MRRAFAAFAAAFATLAFAGQAAADVRHARLGEVAAALSLTRQRGTVGNLRLVVTRAGTRVFSGPIATASGRPGALQETPRVRRFLDARVRVLDLNGDGVGEVVVDLAEPGAYCCSHSVIVGAGSDGVYRALELDWGSYGSAAVATPIKRGYVLVARDARLEERFTPHVLSFEPVRLWYWHHGAVQDVLAGAADGSSAATSHGCSRRGASCCDVPDHATLDLRGLQAAIAGDRLLLGEPPGVAAPGRRSGRWDGWAAHLRAARRGGRLAHDEPRLQLDVQRLEPLVVEQAQQQAHGHAAHLGERLAHRRQRRVDDRGLLGVVEADDRDVVRNPQAALARDAHRADRGVVVEGEDRGRRIGLVQQRSRRPSHRPRSPKLDSRMIAGSGGTPAAAMAPW